MNYKGAVFAAAGVPANAVSLIPVASELSNTPIVPIFPHVAFHGHAKSANDGPPPTVNVNHLVESG